MKHFDGGKNIGIVATDSKPGKMTRGFHGTMGYTERAVAAMKATRERRKKELAEKAGKE